MTQVPKSSFRVIVVGAGVAGLTASHCLQKAGIDHVVLERGQIAPEEGSSIAIYPHGARMLKQLGCLETLKACCFPMDRYINRSPNGKVLVDSSFFDFVKDNHGHDILLLERRVFLQKLYDMLPDKSYVRVGCKVADIVDDHNGISVHLADGSIEEGDMVIGCDGVHSLVRDKMWTYANAVEPGSITVQEKKSISTSWNCLIGMAPPTPGMGEKDMTVIHNDQYSFLVLTQPDKTFFFVFFRLANAFSWPKRVRYTEADMEEAAAKVGDHPISESLIFEELWKRRVRGNLICIEEGVLKKWWFGRTVLAGDSAHKITPNIALGGNSSMESVVVLVNHLHQLLLDQQGARPSRASLNKVFAEYQKAREVRMKHIMNYSSLITKLQAWDNPLLKFVTRFIVPYAPDRLIADDLGKIIRQGPKLDFVPLDEDFKLGRVTWADDKIVDEVKPDPGQEEVFLVEWKGAKDHTMGDVSLKGNVNGGLSNLVQLIGALTALTSAFFFMIFVN